MLLPLLPVLVAMAQPPAPAAPPFGGPVIAPRVERPTLVSYDMSGRLRDLENSPEQEALRLLDLDAASRAAAEQVLTSRAARIDAFVTDNLLMFGQLDSAGKAGAKLDATMLLAKIMERGWPLIIEGPQRGRIAQALPPVAATKFRALIAEYRRAWWKQAYADARAKGDHPPAIAVAIAERAMELGKELGRSYERQAGMGTLIADYLLAGVALTPEQQQTVRDLKLDMLRRTNFKPSEKDQQILVLGIVANLPEAEREKVIRKIVNR
jgi:hypothetical protein